ncbi:hypothetical protein [Luteimicrobium sp. DT211]|uniref:hypothetical protein n=1 Tax=Luteimicrobium sp. DT211 TaxID=3393412 RepID=UPI003CEB43D6
MNATSQRIAGAGRQAYGENNECRSCGTHLAEPHAPHAPHCIAVCEGCQGPLDDHRDTLCNSCAMFTCRSCGDVEHPVSPSEDDSLWCECGARLDVQRDALAG